MVQYVIYRLDSRSNVCFYVLRRWLRGQLWTVNWSCQCRVDCFRKGQRWETRERSQWPGNPQAKLYAVQTDRWVAGAWVSSAVIDGSLMGAVWQMLCYCYTQQWSLLSYHELISFSKSLIKCRLMLDLARSLPCKKCNLVEQQKHHYTYKCVQHSLFSGVDTQTFCNHAPSLFGV